MSADDDSPGAPLRERIKRGLDDRQRQEVFDARVYKIRNKRIAAGGKYPHWEELRERAAAIKAHTVAHLGEYVERFAERAEHAGAQVHFARNGVEANAIIGDLCERHSVTQVTKSKSMTTEECQLNQHLEGRGIDIVDTDLGEWILQLLREAPSHIVAPAIHRNADEVAALFSKHFGTPADEHDPQRLTAFARSILRERFLSAQLGITGCNFAVAETGSVVVVENEGNSLLTTSVPDVHVAVMGLEKVIPRWQDLAVFVNLLARSATGQRITAYTSHYTGPQRRAANEAQLPERELHIVLLDNGRSEVLGDGERSQALGCIRCGACMNVCPVYRRAGGHAYGWVYPGPIGSVLAPTMSRHSMSQHSVASDGAELPFASSLCGACTEACPVKIDLHELLIQQRARMLKANRGVTPPYKNGVSLLRYPSLLRWGGKIVRHLLPYLRGHAGSWEAPVEGEIQRNLPELATESFSEWWQRRQRSQRHARDSQVGESAADE